VFHNIFKKCLSVVSSFGSVLFLFCCFCIYLYVLYLYDVFHILLLTLQTYGSMECVCAYACIYVCMFRIMFPGTYPKRNFLVISWRSQHYTKYVQVTLTDDWEK
jgi:hypothetical protein